MRRSFILLLALWPLMAPAQNKLPFQDPALPIDTRVSDLVSRMTLQEKVTQLFNGAEAIDRLGVPAYNWWNEALHGVARAGKATVFPQAIGLAATFDEDLMHRIGEAISDEARAKHNFFVASNVRSIYTGLTFWSPNINIFRDPRWGRGQETYGEDPYLTGRMAVNFIRGLQGDDPKYLKTIATAKHYAVHSGPEFSRHTDNIFVNNRDLYSTYLPAFKMAVREAGVQSVMCAYNRFRDKPCCGSDLLLNRILREDFGFDGYVVSDCGAVWDFFARTSHHVVNTSSQAWGWSLGTGTDLNCELSTSFLHNNLDSVVNAGIINERDINLALERLFRARFRLGLFDPPQQVPFSGIPYSVVGSEEHLKLTLQAAEKSLVLLKNNGILPLEKVRKVALIGPNADNFAILIGNYNGNPVRPVTPLKGLQDRLGAANVIYAPGGPLVPGVYAHHVAVGAENLFHSENGKLVRGLKAEYFDNTELTGAPKISRIDSQVDFNWERSPVNNLVEEEFSARWTGVLVPQKTGAYQFGGNLQVKVNGQPATGKELQLEKGKSYDLEATVVFKKFWWANVIEPSARLLWVETSRDYHSEALEAAKKADVVIFCGGISADLEGEEMPLEIDGFSHGDRTHLDLPKNQEALLKDLHQTGKPVIYVNFSGSAMALNWEQENLPAIVQAFYPGEATGTALTRMLFGDFNPSGRLPVTFYKSVDQLPDFKNYAMEGRTYRYFQGEPLYPFGYGLSYTSFSFANFKAPPVVRTGEALTVTVDVTNTGRRDGEEVVQLYLSVEDADYPVPVGALAGFKRVFLKKGETRPVSFTVKPEQFATVNRQDRQVIESHRVLLSLGGSSQVLKDHTAGLRQEIRLEGDTIEIK